MQTKHRDRPPRAFRAARNDLNNSSQRSWRCLQYSKTLEDPLGTVGVQRRGRRIPIIIAAPHCRRSVNYPLWSTRDAMCDACALMASIYRNARSPKVSLLLEINALTNCNSGCRFWERLSNVFLKAATDSLLSRGLIRAKMKSEKRFVHNWDTCVPPLWLTTFPAPNPPFKNAWARPHPKKPDCCRRDPGQRWAAKHHFTHKLLMHQKTYR